MPKTLRSDKDIAAAAAGDHRDKSVPTTSQNWDARSALEGEEAFEEQGRLRPLPPSSTMEPLRHLPQALRERKDIVLPAVRQFPTGFSSRRLR